LIESLENSKTLQVVNQNKQKKNSTKALEMLKDVRFKGEVNGQEVRYVEEEHAMFVAANCNDLAMLMKSVHNSRAFPMTNQENQEERTTKGSKMLKDAKTENEVIEQEQRFFKEKQSKVFTIDHLMIQLY
jgi:hypothetical protein